MGGQVWGGGVIVAVAVALWLVYLLPSWHSRHQYASAERNAVRLNQALRVLAETSETPDEIRLELNARTAAAQQRLAKQVQEQQEQAELAAARARLEVAKVQSAAARSAAKAERAAGVERARAERAAAVEAARAARAAARARPEARRARARRTVRLVATTLTLAGLVVSGVGALHLAATASGMLLTAGLLPALLGALTLHRLSRVATRVTHVPQSEQARRTAEPLQDIPLAEPRALWTPRRLPQPLVSSTGSRAAAVLDEQAARDALRAAARDEAMRELAEQSQPARIDTARVARASASADYSRMGYVDDAEIEAHVRQLLAKRAVGQ